MGRLMIILMLLSTNIFAMGNNNSGSNWVNDWWANNFSSVQAQQRQEVQEQSRCDKKLGKYKAKLEKRPNNKYYKWRYDTWKQQCDEEKLNSLTSQ